jgi:hypothetical protein
MKSNLAITGTTSPRAEEDLIGAAESGLAFATQAPILELKRFARNHHALPAPANGLS